MAWAAALVLASASTVVLVLSDDARLLRLGLVAALWAALIGAFAVARLRNRLADQDEHVADQQRIYELELEQEVAARREFELEAENEARRRVAEESEDEVQALRAELRTLRESLEQILGGDMLFERVALRAESTRVRSLTEGQGDGNRVVTHQTATPQAVAPQNGARELPAAHGGKSSTGPVPPNANESTELITRVSGDDVAAEGAWPMSDAPRQPQEPMRAQPAAVAQPPQPAQTPRKAPVSQQKVTASQRKAPASQQRAPGNVAHAQSAPPVREPASTGNSARQRPAPASENAAPRGTPSARVTSAQNNRAVPGNSPAPPAAVPQSAATAGKAPPTASANDPGAPVPPRTGSEPAQQGPAQQGPAQQGPAQQAPERQPAREQSGSWPNSSASFGSGGDPAAGTPAAGTSAPAGAAAAPAEPSAGESAQPHPGAHTQGTSVNDLLAVYGGSEGSGDSERRRRRRRD